MVSWPRSKVSWSGRKTIMNANGSRSGGRKVKLLVSDRFRHVGGAEDAQNLLGGS